ncbi:PolC-type DNA polymerase III [Allopusillimonas ginsengisoli]|uniref:3'-5' exonuclease n=1 Tax=Allopusillimonas ginsengisoli TaxID=453575 RepID=UPI0010C1603F|nr:3'-5' exonuclease [Allopusillimonas ginsengisoli]
MNVWTTLRNRLRRSSPSSERGAQADQGSANDMAPTLRQLAREAALARPGPTCTLSGQGLIVFDLETTGLDTRRDEVLSVGAVKVDGQAISLGNVFSRVLATQANLKPDNQLIHGLTRHDLEHGTPPRQALTDLLRYASGRLWIAFHAEFDRRMLQRAMLQWLGIRFDPAPLDLAELAPMLCPGMVAPAEGLDGWLHAFKIGVPARHDAAVDAMVTAELALILLSHARRQGYENWGELNQARQRWRRQQLHPNGPMG